MSAHKLLTFLFLFIIASASAQEAIIVQPSSSIGNVRADCPDMFSGNAMLSPITPTGSTFDPQNIVLCYGDAVLVSHQGDFDVTEDPDVSTPAGVRYAVFTSEPNQNGVINQTELLDLTDILKLGSVNLIFASADANGNAIFINDGSFLADAGISAPVQLWFAPITVHNTQATQPNDFFENTDACIHINSASAFSVTYLSPLSFTTSTTSATTGSITASGGIPELDGSAYTATLTNLTTQAVTVLPSGGHPVFDYDIPSTADNYRVTISDDNGCSYSQIINFLPGTPVEVAIPDTTAAQNQIVCLPLTVKDFKGIGSFSFALRWNPGIILYDTFFLIHPALKDAGGTSALQYNDKFSDQGLLFFSWIVPGSDAIDISDDESLFEVCFNTIGPVGGRTNINFDSYKSTIVDFTNLTNSLNFTTIGGSVTIVPSGGVDFNYSICDNEMTVQMVGGKGPFTYELSGPTTYFGNDKPPSFSIPVGSDGNYTLTITDANDDVVSRDLTIQPRIGPSAVSTVDNTCSPDAPNGRAYLNTAPAGNYQIEWTYNGQKYYNIDTLDGIAGGQVTMVITDENHCRSPEGTYIVNNNGLQADYTVISPPSQNGDPGKLGINISGGTPDYTIKNSILSISTKGDTIIDVYGSGSYRVEDMNGCRVNLDVTTAPTCGETFTLTNRNVTDINCENNGEVGSLNDHMGQFSGNVSSTGNQNFVTASLFFTDGTPVNGTKFIVNRFSGTILGRFLEPGDYEWQITGECSDTTFLFSIEDLASTPPSVDATISAIGCSPGSALGAISLTVFPASGAYNYSWSNGATTSMISDLDTGSYSVTVTDTLSKCSHHEEYTIQAGVVFSKIETTIPCDADTMVDVGVTIRDDYESILWDSGETTEIISVSTPGFYPFTIIPSDANCSPYRDSIFIGSQTGGIRLTEIVQQPVSDCGDPDGIVVAQLNVPKADFGFSWDGGPITNGLNDYRVYDDNVHNLKVYKDNCVAIDTNFSFVFNNIINIDPTIHHVECYGDNNGEITVLTSGNGASNLAFEFDNSGREDLFASYTDLAPGTYELRIIDRKTTGVQCEDIIREYIITEPEPFTVAVDSTQVSPPACTNDANGSLVLVTTGGNPGSKNVLYTYSGGAGNTTDLFLDSLRASNYSIRVVDSLGCIARVNYELVDPEPVNFSIPPIEEPTCAGYTTTVIINNANGGSGSDYQFAVDGGVPVPLGESLDILAGSHEITVFDGNLCSVTNSVTIREPTPISVTFDQPDTLEVSLGEMVEITALINGENTISDYIWTPESADSLSVDNTLAFTAVDNGILGLEVIDSRGCIGSNEVFLLVRKRRDIGIPNAFSPNGDGHNDLFTIVPGPSIRLIKNFQVYDRYGTLMWEESDIHPSQAQITGWDGTYSGTPAMFDVYVALVKVEYIDGQVIQRISDVTLVK